MYYLELKLFGGNFIYISKGKCIKTLKSDKIYTMINIYKNMFVSELKLR